MVWDKKNTILRRAAKLQLMGQGIIAYSAGGGNLATAMRMQGRIPIFFGPWPTKEWRLPVDGFYVPGAITLTNLPKAYACNFSLELQNAAGSIASVPILWGGSQQKVINPGDALSLSDDWCATNGPIPAGTRGFLRYDISVPTAGILTCANAWAPNAGPSLGLAYWFTTNGAATGNVNGVGQFPGAGSGGNQLLPPIVLRAMLGTYDNLRTSALLLGDSRVAGVATGTQDNYSGKTYLTRAMYDLNVPYVSFAFSGTNLSQWAALAAPAYAIAAYVSDIFIGFPINDITAGRTAAQIKADYTTLIGTLKGINPAAKIWLVKPEPHTNTLTQAASSVTSSGTTATFVIPDTSKLVEGGTVVVAGATPAAYNGTFNGLHIVDANTFTVTFAGGASPATGAITVHDGWSTAANQTPTAGCEYPSSIRMDVIAWMDTLVGVSVTGVLDPNVVAEVNGGSGIWPPNGTLDGLHAGDQMNTTESIEVKKQLLSKGFIPNTGTF